MTTYSAKATPLVCALIVLAPIAAAAQSPAQPGAGPMQIEQMENGFVVAPDLKATRVSGATRGLAGAYAGFLMDNTLLLGGAAYWLPTALTGCGWRTAARSSDGKCGRTSGSASRFARSSAAAGRRRGSTAASSSPDAAWTIVAART